jgi:trigger factor
MLPVPSSAAPKPHRHEGATAVVKSTVENLSPTRVRLAVEVPFEDLRSSLDAAYKSIAQQIRVPGFRPGRVPARIIDQRVGRATVLQEAINEALPGIYTAAAREHELQPLGQPEIDVTNLSDNESLSFTAEVDVRPEIPLPDDLDGLAVAVDDVQVSDEDVEQQLGELRERFGSLRTVEHPIETGNYVSLDLVARVDGEQVEDGSASNLSYEVGSGNLVEGLDDALVGKSAGESATFTAPLQYGEHAGQDAEITATINSVKEKELPELDDEFAQLASEFDTLDELRADLRERLARVRRLEQGAQARDRLVEKLVETVDFPVPESAVNAEVDYREHDVVHSFNHDDAMVERYLQMQGQSREQFRDQLREAAEKSVRVQFILDAWADKAGVQVGNEELTEYLVRQAGRYEMSPQDFANQVVEGGNLPALVADVRRNKALATLLESARITDASGNQVDLSALAESGDVVDDLDDAVAEPAADDQ